MVEGGVFNQLQFINRQAWTYGNHHGFAHLIPLPNAVVVEVVEVRRLQPNLQNLQVVVQGVDRNRLANHFAANRLAVCPPSLPIVYEVSIHVGKLDATASQLLRSVCIQQFLGHIVTLLRTLAQCLA